MCRLEMPRSRSGIYHLDDGVLSCIQDANCLTRQRSRNHNVVERRDGTDSVSSSARGSLKAAPLIDVQF
jgi:hypothetical protein